MIYDTLLSIINNRSKIQFFANLYCRWEDEKEYENIEDYGKAMLSALPTNTKLIKATKKPFGVVFSLEGVKVHLIVKKYPNGYSLAYKILP